MAASRQTYTHDLQCSHASVGLAQARPNNRWYLTKNTNVKTLELLSYTRVELWTIREVNWNDTNLTTILLLWVGGGV